MTLTPEQKAQIRERLNREFRIQPTIIDWSRIYKFLISELSLALAQRNEEIVKMIESKKWTQHLHDDFVQGVNDTCDSIVFSIKNLTPRVLGK